MSRVLPFALGVAADLAFGDPPTRWHPVGLIGRAAMLLHGLAPESDHDREQARERYGLAVALGLPVAGALAASALRRFAARRHRVAGLAFEVALFDATTALRTLLARAGEVQAALEHDDLKSARALTAMHLVSRDTSGLDASELAGATIESVAENLSDGVIAPWLAFALAGLPGAVGYRIANTLDALWGYRIPEFKALGHAAARLDDALNLLPARLTALALVLAAVESGDTNRAYSTWRHDAARTASPNAGHPMAAMAGALGVTLTKRDAYILGGGLRAPEAADIGRAIALARRAALICGTCLLGALLWDEVAR